MLVLHPTSRCDVCLEPYASDSSPQAPHAIPCGHIFCKACLNSTEPANCPLCRQPYVPVRAKILHVDRPDEPDFLQRLVLAWDASEDDVVDLLTRIREWLEGKDEEEYLALRKAVNVFSKFQKLKTRRVDDHRVIRRLRDQIESEDRLRASESEESKVVEMSLLDQIQTLQSQLSKTQDEVVHLRVQVSRPGMSELSDLRNKVERYETELEDLRPLMPRVKQYEHELRILRQELDYYAYPSTMRDNPLPQPPAPVAFDFTLSGTVTSGSLSSTSSALPGRGAGARALGSDTAYTNGYSSGQDTSPNYKYAPRKGKGKEREPGPSYNLNASSSALSSADTSITPTSANPYASYNTNPSSEEVLPGASPRRRVVPSSKSKPSHLPTPTHTMDPKLVSGARPDLPTPPTPDHQIVTFNPPLSQLQRGGHTHGRAGTDPARDYTDPYTLAAAYVTEYAAGYGTGYQLAEYTPGQAAVVVEPGQAQGQGNGQAQRRPHGVPLVENAIAYVNGQTQGYMHGPGNGETWERRDTGLGLENALGVSLPPPDTGATPTVRSSQLSKDGNSQVYNYDTGSTTSGDSASLILSTSSRAEGNPYPSQWTARDSASQSSLKTQTTGYLTDTATVSSFNTGLSRATEDSMLSRSSSLRHQSRRSGDQRTLQSVLGLGLPLNPGSNGAGAVVNGNTFSTSRRANRHNSLPVQPMPTGTVVATATTTTTAPQPQPTSAPVVGDDQSVRTAYTASSWGTINTHSAPLLPWQSTGSSLNLPLRSFAPGAGLPLSDQGTGFETGLAAIVQGLENFGPFVPEGMVVPHTGSGENTSRSGARASTGGARDDSGNGAFPVRESDEERTPMSRSTRTLASVSSVGATNGSGVAYMTDMLGAQSSSPPQAPSGHRDRNRERERDRDRDRERPRDRDRARSRDRRRQSHPAPFIPTDANEGTRHTQMTSDSEHNPSHQSRAHQNTAGATYMNAQQMSQMWFMNPAAVPTSSYIQPHTSQPASASRPQTQAQPQHQPQGQSQSRRTQRRSSVSTAPVPINTQHTGSQSQSIGPNTAPIHASATWSEAGYYTDGPNSSAHHNHNNHNSNHSSAGVLTSPTLFNSSSSTNALGLDGLSDPRPLQITAPTPIVSSRSFLRSFSYDDYS